MPTPPPRSRVPTSAAEMLARCDSMGFTKEWFKKNVPPLTAEELRAPLYPDLPHIPPSLIALRDVPQSTTPPRQEKSAERTQPPPALQNVPQPATSRPPTISAERTQAPRALKNVPQPATSCPPIISAKRTQPASALQNVPQSPTTLLNQPQIPPSPYLTPRQERAARLLVLGHSATSTAALLGVERHSIHRWKRLPHFNHQIQLLLAAS